MQKILWMVGATVGGAFGWWLGSLFGEEMTAFIFSAIGTLVGVYAGIKIAREYLN